MSESFPPILDAGPGLNFFSIHRERLLFQVVGRLACPEIVLNEMRGKAARDARFEATTRVLSKIRGTKLFDVLSDEATKELNRAVQRIAGAPLGSAGLPAKNLGEVMVIAHAVVRAEAGQTVVVIIDDGDGRRRALLEQARLMRMQLQGVSCGRIELLSTVGILKQALEEDLIDKGELRELYQRMRALDDGLIPFEKTSLTSLS